MILENLPLIADVRNRKLTIFTAFNTNLSKSVLVECFGCDSYGYVESNEYYCPNCGCTGGMMSLEFENLK